MANVNEKIKHIKRILELAESAKTCEKARIPMVKAEALRLYQSMKESFVAFQSISNSAQSSVDHDELHVLMAEAAFAVELYSESREQIEHYFQRSPQKGQFYCRGKQLLGLIIDYEARGTNGAESIRQRKIALTEVLEAMTVATQGDNTVRYKFLVYNISVTCWKIVSSFLRVGRAKYFVNELTTISNALEQSNDPDIDWRIRYLSATAVCLHDDGQVKPASDSIDKAIAHTDKMLGATLAAEKTAGEALKLSTQDAESVLSALRKLDDWEELKRKKPKIDPDLPEDHVYPPIEVPPLEGLATLGYDELKKRLDESQAKKAIAEATMRDCVDQKIVHQERLAKLFMQRVHSNPADSKVPLAAPLVTQSLRTRVLVQMQCILSGCIAEKDVVSTIAQCEKDLTAAAASVAVIETMLDMARSLLQINNENAALAKAAAYRILEVAEKSTMTSPVISVKVDLCRALRLVNEIDENVANKVIGRRLRSREAEGFSIQSRLDALKILERIVIMCERLDNANLLEEICVAIWNTAVPMLQRHLRLQVHNALRLAAASLESISSPLTRLRASLHLELAKCEELSDYVAAAKEEAVKAVSCDYGSLNDALVATKFGVIVGEGIELDRDRPLDHIIKPVLTEYSVRSSVYDSPSDVEGKVLLILQQIKESSSLRFQNDMLLKATSAMLESIAVYPVGSDMKSTALSASKKFASTKSPQKAVRSTKGGLSEMEQRRQALATMSVGDLNPQVPNVSIEDLAQAVTKLRVNPPTPEGKAAPKAAAKGAPVPEIAPTPAVEYCTFTQLTQSRAQIMATIARLSHARHNVLALQQAALFVLKLVWNPEDPFCRELIDSQIEVFYLLAECLVFRLAQPKSDEAKELSSTMTLKSTSVGIVSTDVDIELDSRALGLETEDQDALAMKKLVLTSLLHGLKLSQLMKDQYGIQNAIIYFWNLHIHISRKGLYAQTVPEVFTFVQAAIESIESAKTSALPVTTGKSSITLPIPGYKPITQLDERLRISILSMYAALLASRGDPTAAADAAFKGCAGVAQNIGDIYSRRRLCEQAYVYLNLATNAAAAAGGKGGKTASKAAEPGKIDNPILTVYTLLVQAESATVDVGGAAPGAEHSKFASDKAVAMMDAEVATYMKTLEIPQLPQESYDQIVEMQAEIWTRITRLRILQDDIHGAQKTAERCMALVTEAILREHAASLSANALDELNRLSPRVWRWVGVCERYFGIAISKIIQSEGQDPALQNELRLASLRHFTLASLYAQRGSRPDLVVAAAVEAWNISRLLVDVEVKSVRKSLFALQRQIIDTVLQCAMSEPMAPAILQQFYLAVTSQHCSDMDWNTALKVIMEAFEYVPNDLQKPLWRWRVIVMSKLGKNVLDGIQKLKEDDPSLQARVYSILARASPSPSLQLGGYSKSMESLSSQPATNPEKIEYLLETVQWMGSAGVARNEIKVVAQSVVDAVYALDEISLGLLDPVDENAAQDKATGLGKTANKTSALAKSSTSRSQSSVGSRRSATNSDGSSAGSDDPLNPVLTCQHLEQAARASFMLALVESTATARLERCMNAIYFLGRFHATWAANVTEAHRQTTYSKLSPEQQAESPFELFELSPEALAEMEVPQDFIQLLKWQPSVAFVSATKQVAQSQPLLVPSIESLSAAPLTFHYVLWAADALDRFGFPVLALYCLAWLRAVFLFVPSQGTAIGKETALACAHFKARNLINRSGLSHFASMVPTSLADIFHDTSKPSPEIASFVPYLVKMIGSAPEFAGKGAMNSDFVGAAEQADLFGFYTLTNILGGSVDVDNCALSICDELRELGMTSQCRRLALALRVGFTLRKNSRGLLHTAITLAGLDLLDGRLRESIALLLSCKPDLVASGDPLLASKHITFLATAFSSQGEYAEAIRVCSESLDLMEQLVVLSPTSALTTRPKSTANNNKSSVETSFELAQAICDISSLWLELTVNEIMQTIRTTGIKDLLVSIFDLYSNTVDRCERLIRGCVAAVGPVSNLAARMLSALSRTSLKIINIIDVYASKTLAEDEFPAWKVLAVKKALNTLELAVRTRREVLKCVSATQRKFVVGSGIDITEGIKVGLIGGDVTIMMSMVQLQLGLDELELSHQHFNHAGIISSHIIGPKLKTEKVELTRIEQYLLDTRPHEDMKVSKFVASSLVNAVLIIPSSIQLLSGTGLYHSIAEMMLTVVNCAKACESGGFDGAWLALSAPSVPDEAHHAKHASHSPSHGHGHGHGSAGKEKDKHAPAVVAEPPPDEDASKSHPHPVVEPAAVALRQQLIQQTTVVLTGCSKLCYIPVFVAESCAMLADTLGSCNASASAAWILQLQSFSSRDYLFQIWRDSLNPATDVYASLSRLIGLEKQCLPASTIQKTVEAELTFLHQASIAWRRLNISADPATILSAPSPAHRAMYLCIQLCPRLKSVYVCAGNPSVGSPSAGSYSLPGSWVVDKIPFSESMKRQIIQLKQQHTQWRDDAAKLISVYGDNMSAALDVKGDALESQFSDAKAWRKEKALEDKIRVLVDELATLMQGVIGLESNAYRYLKEQIHAAAATKAKDSKTASPPLVLLIDPLMQDLPWEGLSVVSDLFEGLSCRDFSVHMLGHRCSSLVPPTPVGSAPAGKGGASTAGGLDGNGNVPITSSATKVLMDPFEDDNGNASKGFERPSISSLWSKLHGGTVPGAAKWSPVNASKATISIQDWIGVTAPPLPTAAPTGKGAPAAGGDANAGKLYTVVSFIPGKLSNYLPVCDLASMNFEQLALFIVSDQGHSSNSILRQNALDNLKAKKEIALESPHRLIALASLAGSGSVLIPMWATSLASQARFVETFLTSFTKQQQGLCAALMHSKNLAHTEEHASNGHGHAAGHGKATHGDAGSTASMKLRAVPATPPVMKNAVKHARVLYGVPTIAYVDN